MTYQEIYNIEESKDDFYSFLVDEYTATEEELNLVTDICGYHTGTLLDVLYARTGFRNIEQYIEDRDGIIYDEEEF